MSCKAAWTKITPFAVQPILIVFTPERFNHYSGLPSSKSSILLRPSPQLAVGKSPSAEETGFLLPGINAGMQRLYPKMAAALSDLAHEWRVPCYDMTLSMTGFSETLYVDYVHLNDKGQTILGDKIADFLHTNSFQEDVTASYRRRLNHITHTTNNQPENGIVFPGFSSFTTH